MDRIKGLLDGWQWWLAGALLGVAFLWWFRFDTLGQQLAFTLGAGTLTILIGVTMRALHRRNRRARR